MDVCGGVSLITGEICQYIGNRFSVIAAESMGETVTIEREELRIWSISLTTTHLI